MPQNIQFKEKLEVLKQQGNLNPHSDHVSDSFFVDDKFFDPFDLLQEKYEMLRRVQLEGKPVTQAVVDFGFSRRAFYQIQAIFKQEGLAGLLQKKRGPKRRHKLTGVVMDFLNGRILEKGDLPAGVLVEEVFERFGLQVHKRTIERALSHQKKNCNG
ncbi:MAG: helix-turn-helix domain containing protein [SAR324 cluster bacterium]|nr:helix-turn-helix domain containing protein [SAR324 cluster bacterium]